MQSCNELVVDVETTISNKGNPFDSKNKCVMVGMKFLKEDAHIKTDNFTKLQYAIDKASFLIGFNIKFDLHWLRKVGLDISKVRVWDCQVAEFLLNNQKTPYPSLDDAAEKYGFNKKLDIVKLEYWDKKIDTDIIPPNILSEYLQQDLSLTQQVYEKQRQLLKETKLLPLFNLLCQDLLVLEEIEWNGILFNTEKAREKVKEIKIELLEIYDKFMVLLGGVPFNPNSNDHVSCILYGGDIVEYLRVPIGVYKSGDKIGQPRCRIIEKRYTLPRLVEPLKNTLVKKPAGSPEYWLVNDTILRKLKLSKEAKVIVDLLKRQSELDKLYGTYLEGWSNLIDNMNWEHNIIHGSLNQCVAITGRLSCTKPNMQNADPITKIYMESRYDS